jgi:hypothetical protein
MVGLAALTVSTNVPRVPPRRTLGTRSTRRRPPPASSEDSDDCMGSPPRPRHTGAPSSAPGSVGRMSRGSPRMRQTPPTPPRGGVAATVTTRATVATTTVARVTAVKAAVTAARG